MKSNLNFTSTFLIRLSDIIISLIVISLCLPILLAVSLILFFSFSGPVFYIQKRVTKNQRLFKLVKFRSMKVHASRRPADSQGYLTMDLQELRRIRTDFKTTGLNDSRVTPLGRFLRNSSIDELPQLFSVLVGDMSIVGPRPDTPIQRADYEPTIWSKRCSVKAGLTGLAQVNGRSAIDLSDRVSCDIYWVENVSLYLYFKVLLKTPLVLLSSTN